MALALPSMIIASPATGSAGPSDLVLRELLERQTDLSSLLGQLTSSLKGIQDLLSADSLANIKEVVTDLADLLKAPTTNQTKALIGTASDLLGGDSVGKLIDSLPTLLDSIGGLVTPALITNVTDLIGNAHELLTPTLVSQAKGLINDIAPVSYLIMLFKLMISNTLQLVSAISQVISTLLSAVLGGGS